MELNNLAQEYASLFDEKKRIEEKLKQLRQQLISDMRDAHLRNISVGDCVVYRREFKSRKIIDLQAVKAILESSGLNTYFVKTALDSQKLMTCIRQHQVIPEEIGMRLQSYIKETRTTYIELKKEGQNPRQQHSGHIIEHARKTNPNAYNPWDTAEEVRLLEHLKSGMDMASIAASMGRTLSAIRIRAERIDAKQKSFEAQAKNGTCADCDRVCGVDDMVDVDGDMVCNTCVESKCEKCKYCGDYFYVDNCPHAEADSRKSEMCELCNESYVLCSKCDQHYELDELGLPSIDDERSGTWNKERFESTYVCPDCIEPELGDELDEDDRTIECKSCEYEYNPAEHVNCPSCGLNNE
jgi:hypothetical protein